MKCRNVQKQWNVPGKTNLPTLVHSKAMSTVIRHPQDQFTCKLVVGEILGQPINVWSVEMSKQKVNCRGKIALEVNYGISRHKSKTKIGQLSSKRFKKSLKVWDQSYRWFTRYEQSNIVKNRKSKESALQLQKRNRFKTADQIWSYQVILSYNINNNITGTIW